MIVNPNITDIDIVTILPGENISYVNFMKIEMGTIRASETVLIKSKLQEKTNEILAYAVPTLQQNSIVMANIIQTFIRAA